MAKQKKKLDELTSRILIQNSKEGRKDGAYSRLLGNDELGALISRIHATSISAGTFIENYITQIAPTLHVDDIPKIFNNTLKRGIFLLPKKIIKDNITKFLQLKNAIEPDFIIVDSKNHKCIVIELKDGDNFDTKKSQGEVNNLNMYADALKTKLPYPYIVEIKVCMFNQDDKLKIVSGFKGCITKQQAMSGNEFCKILGISKDEIENIRSKATNKNFEFVIQELLKIDCVSQRLQKILEDK